MTYVHAKARYTWLKSNFLPVVQMRAETKITDKRTKKMAKNFHEQRPAKNKLTLKHFANSF